MGYIVLSQHTSAALMLCEYVQNIDPTLLLTAFLPILLFAGAFALEWHTVRRLIWSSLLLAGMLPALCIIYRPLHISQYSCAPNVLQQGVLPM